MFELYLPFSLTATERVRDSHGDAEDVLQIWPVGITVTTTGLFAGETAFDVSPLYARMDALQDELRERVLNDVLAVERVTVSRFARWIYERVASCFQETTRRVARVKVEGRRGVTVTYWDALS